MTKCSVCDMEVKEDYYCDECGSMFVKELYSFESNIREEDKQHVASHLAGSLISGIIKTPELINDTVCLDLSGAKFGDIYKEHAQHRRFKSVIYANPTRSSEDEKEERTPDFKVGVSKWFLDKSRKYDVIILGDVPSCVTSIKELLMTVRKILSTSGVALIYIPKRKDALIRTKIELPGLYDVAMMSGFFVADRLIASTDNYRLIGLR